MAGEPSLCTVERLEKLIHRHLIQESGDPLVVCGCSRQERWAWGRAARYASFSCPSTPDLLFPCLAVHSYCRASQRRAICCGCKLPPCSRLHRSFSCHSGTCPLHSLHRCFLLPLPLLAWWSMQATNMGKSSGTAQGCSLLVSYPLPCTDCVLPTLTAAATFLMLLLLNSCCWGCLLAGFPVQYEVTIVGILPDGRQSLPSNALRFVTPAAG